MKLAYSPRPVCVSSY